MGKKFYLLCAAYVLCTALLGVMVLSVVERGFHWLETNGAKTLWEGKK